MKQGWEIKRLSEIGKVFNGNSINEKVKKDNYSDLDDGFPYIATKDISYNSEINYENGIKIPFSEKNSFKIAPKNTVLICAEGGSAGRKIGFTNQEVCFGNKLFALATKNDIESRYVYYYYFSETFQKHFSVELAGIIGGVSMNKFKDLEIPLPPLPEQQRIVTILDEAFAAIAKAKANAEQNLKNAKELFESYLQGVFENKGEDWKEKTIGEVCDLIDSLHKTPKYNKEGAFPMVRVTEIKYGNLDISGALRVDEDIYKEFSKKHIPKIGDIVFSRVGASFGVSSLVVSNELFCLGQNTVFIVPKLNPYYCYHFLNSRVARSQMNKLVAGAAQPTISLKSIKELNISIPPTNQIEKIVGEIHNMAKETQKLEAIYQQKINDLEELKKSVLQKAFSGELKTEKVLV